MWQVAQPHPDHCWGREAEPGVSHPQKRQVSIPLTVEGPDCSPGLSEKSQPLSWLKSRARNSQQTGQCLARRCSFSFCLETAPTHSISAAHLHPGTIWKPACPIPPGLLPTCCTAWRVSSPQFMSVWATNTCLFYMNRWKQELKYMESRKEGRIVKLGHFKNGNSEDRLCISTYIVLLNQDEMDILCKTEKS